MKIALVGNQNSGKSTLFNLLTGSNQKIGNWPGVTVERKVGTIIGTNHQLVDLPGIYSFSPYTLEEEISRRYILEENPDLIINIIDATSIERSLYLTTQLLELDINVIVVLNMGDILEKKGLAIDKDKLSEFLGVDVVKISALKNEGIPKLIKKIDDHKNINKSDLKIFAPFIESKIEELSEEFKSNHKRFLLIKLLEQDKNLLLLETDSILEAKNNIENKYSRDIETIIATQRYNFIEDVKSKVITQSEVGESITDKLDRIFLNQWLSLPIFAVVMFLIYFLAVGVVGQQTVEIVEGAFESAGVIIESFLSSIGASAWATSLIVDGMLAGVGAVLAFVPQLIILFLAIALLETTGYMSRIAFILDRVFRKFGLSGKSLIPFIIGSGCSVPAVMSTRTIEDERERHMSIVLTPFIPCSAKLPIIILFSSYFFGKFSGLAAASLYFFSIVVILFSAIIMKKMFFKGEPSPFISELPEYKAVNPKHLLADVTLKTWEFIKRAGTIILLGAIFIWVLVSFSWSFQYGVNIDKSILASIGKLFSWFFYPMLGEFSWAASVSAIQGLIAKEQVVSSMSIIAGLSSDITDGAIIFSSGVFGFFTTPSAYAFMAFNLFSAPCIGTIAAMRRELGSTKKVLFAIGFQTILAWIIAVLIFLIGSLIGVIL